MSGDTLQTEFEFTLPKGYVDEEGSLHEEGTMRLATAADEILPLKDPRVKSNPSYMTVILLSRVVTRLGSIRNVSPGTIEGLYVADLAYLQDMYERVNDRGVDAVDTTCPECGETFAVEVSHGAGDGEGGGKGGGTPITSDPAAAAPEEGGSGNSEGDETTRPEPPERATDAGARPTGSAMGVGEPTEAAPPEESEEEPGDR